jgi:hypothetical protein
MWWTSSLGGKPPVCFTAPVVFSVLPSRSLTLSHAQRLKCYFSVDTEPATTPDLLTIVLRMFVLQVAVDVPQTTADGQVGF